MLYSIPQNLREADLKTSYNFYIWKAVSSKLLALFNVKQKYYFSSFMFDGGSLRLPLMSGLGC